MINYEKKHVVVTGANGGMGKILCDRLAAMGENLSLCSNEKAPLEELAETLKEKYSVSVFAKQTDIADEAQMEAFFNEAEEANGKMYAMANLAGLSIPGKIEETPQGVFDTIMDVNVKGTFLAGKFFAVHAAEEAIIVNIGSVAGKKANPNAPLYCTAKAAVNMLSQAMLLQMGQKGIRVTTINPGGTDTPFWGTRSVDKSKLMQPEDVVEIILFALTSNPKIQIHDIYFESSARF